MVHGRPEVSRLEEVHAVQVGYVHPPLVGLRAVRAVLLDVHAEKADLGPVDVLEGEQGFHPVREGLGHLAVVHEPESGRKTAMSKTLEKGISCELCTIPQFFVIL